MDTYYKPEHLPQFSTVEQGNKELADAFFAYYGKVFQDGALAAEPLGEAEVQGHALFMATGCGGCHTVRGTEANGEIGPDLTHVGSRHSLAAATLPNNPEAFARWIVDNQHIKPENLMPPYEIFTEAELAQLAIYLESLE